MHAGQNQNGIGGAPGYWPKETPAALLGDMTGCPKADPAASFTDCPKAVGGIAKGLPADKPKALDCPKAD